MKYLAVISFLLAMASLSTSWPVAETEITAGKKQSNETVIGSGPVKKNVSTSLSGENLSKTSSEQKSVNSTSGQSTNGTDGCTPNLGPWDLWAQLQDAVRSKNLTEVQRLVTKCGADVNKRGFNDNNALHEAVRQKMLGVEPIVSFLLENGANPNLATFDGDLPLHLAAKKAIYPMPLIQLLVAHGADVDARDDDSATAEQVAFSKDRLFVAKFLHGLRRLRAAFKAGGAAEKEKNPAVECPTEGDPDELIKAAVKDGDLDEVKRLVVHCGFDVTNKAAIDGNNPLHEAAKWGRPEMVTLFLDGGAEINKKNAQGLAPIHLAIMSNSTNSTGVVEVLLNRTADVNVETRRYGFPAQDARQLARQYKLDEVEAMLDQAYDVWFNASKTCVFVKIQTLSKKDVRDVMRNPVDSDGFNRELFDVLEDVLSHCRLKDSALKHLWKPMLDFFKSNYVKEGNAGPAKI